MMAYMDSGFEIFTSIFDRLALQMSKCQLEAKILERMMKERKYPKPEPPPHEGTIHKN